jgi:hypothetical protein
MGVDPIEDLVELPALTDEIELCEVLVIEESPSDFRTANRCADDLAVIEGADVVHRVLVRTLAGARELPVGYQTAKHTGLRRLEQFGQWQAFGPTTRAFTYSFRDLQHVSGACARRGASSYPVSRAAIFASFRTRDHLAAYAPPRAAHNL